MQLDNLSVMCKTHACTACIFKRAKTTAGQDRSQMDDCHSRCLLQTHTQDLKICDTCIQTQGCAGLHGAQAAADSSGLTCGTAAAPCSPAGCPPAHPTECKVDFACPFTASMLPAGPQETGAAATQGVPQGKKHHPPAHRPGWAQLLAGQHEQRGQLRHGQLGRAQRSMRS